MNGDEFRRLLPPPRRRPNPLDVGLRWRVEIVAVAVAVAACHAFGARPVGVCALVLAAVVAAVPGVRRGTVAVLQAVVVPHRVRSGLLQAGVADRDGRLPWLVAARGQGDVVRVTVWLRSGTSLRDLVVAAPLVATACGAREVAVERPSVRQDRAVLVVIRPRWGWWTR